MTLLELKHLSIYPDLNTTSQVMQSCLQYTGSCDTLQRRTKCKILSLHAAANNGLNFYHALQILIELWHVADPVTFRSTSFKRNFATMLNII